MIYDKGRFIVKCHAQILSHVGQYQNVLSSTGIHILNRIRQRAKNQTLQNRYTLGRGLQRPGDHFSISNAARMPGGRKIVSFIVSSTQSFLNNYLYFSICTMCDTRSQRVYKKVMSYPVDSCVPGYREAEGRGRKQDRRDLSTWVGHGEKQKKLGSQQSETWKKRVWKQKRLADKPTL